MSKPVKNIRRRGYCKVVPCDQIAVALSLVGMPVCLNHGHMLGGYTLLPGFEKLDDFAKPIMTIRDRDTKKS